MSNNIRQTKFNDEWMTDPKYSMWIGKDPNSDSKARCVLCGVSFDLSNMGVRAVVSHAQGLKHGKKAKEILKVKQEVKPLFAFWGKKQNSDSVITVPEESSSSVESMDTSLGELPPPPTPIPAQPVNEKNALSKFVTNDEVLTAEIMWAMKTVMNHFSCNASAKTDKLFQKMFPDSHIAKQFSCGATKCSYLITFGLAEYYKHDLSRKIKPDTFFVVSFDESLNRTLQEEQMDLLLRFWDSERDRVVTRYFDSVFLGHTKSVDLLSKFKSGLSSLNTGNMIQVSMDGPATNWKFYEALVKDRQESDPDISSLINVGSCGLHIVHGAFHYGAGKSGWKVDSILRSLYWCFADSPARREDYLTANDSKAAFPLKFCSTRWLEDVRVAERAIQIWQKVKEYMKSAQKLPVSKQPTCQSFSNLKEHVQDPLVPAKLHFFVSVAKILTPFLEKFQTDKPMVPFLSEELYAILYALLSRFVKQSVLDSVSSPVGLTKVDTSKKENVVSPEKVEIGFASRQAIEEAQKCSQLSQRTLYEFYQECIKFLNGLVFKMQERSPLQYSIVRALQALDPRFISLDPKKATDKFQHILKKLLELKWLTPQKCDDVLQQFKTWLNEFERYGSQPLKDFNRQDKRLDSFYAEQLGNKFEYNELWNTMKMLLILSHGQSTIERGFSTNKDILSPNLGKQTLKAFRTVHDGINSELDMLKDKTLEEKEKRNIDIADISVTAKMLAECRGARTRYQQFMDECKKEQEAKEEIDRKSNLKKELKALEVNKRKLELSVESLQKEADDLAVQAEKKRKMELLTKSNAFRNKVKEQKEEIVEMSMKIVNLEKKIESV